MSVSESDYVQMRAGHNRLALIMLGKNYKQEGGDFFLFFLLLHLPTHPSSKIQHLHTHCAPHHIHHDPILQIEHTTMHATRQLWLLALFFSFFSFQHFTRATLFFSCSRALPTLHTSFDASHTALSAMYCMTSTVDHLTRVVRVFFLVFFVAFFLLPFCLVLDRCMTPQTIANVVCCILTT